MKYKNYTLFPLLLALVAFFAVKNNSSQPLTPSENIIAPEKTANVKVKNIIEMNQRTKEGQTQKNTATTAIDPQATKPAVSNELVKTQDNTPTSMPGPINENWNMSATGEYAQEVNLQNSENDCEESCDEENTEIADGKNVNAAATGEFSDQINSDAIFAQAQQKDPNLQPEAKLPDPAEGAPPTTEIGVYTPPQ